MKAELEETIDIALEGEIKERDEQFKWEAIGEWDIAKGMASPNRDFIRLFVQLRWEEYAKRQ